jgi:methionyl aminopeptidase
VHGIPNEKPRILNSGDIVALDLSVSFDGFFTDSAVTLPVGVVDDESRNLIDVAKKALEAGIKVAQPGRKIGDIGFAISEVVRSSPFSLAKDLVGHGLGYALHEEPYVPNFGKIGHGELLTPGLVIAIEPMVNVGRGEIKTLKDGYTIVTKDGSRSAHFEHTIAITDDSNIILTLDN